MDELTEIAEKYEIDVKDVDMIQVRVNAVAASLNPGEPSDPYEVYIKSKTMILRIYASRKGLPEDFRFFGPEEFVEILHALVTEEANFAEILVHIKEHIQEFLSKQKDPQFFIETGYIKESELFQNNREKYPQIVADVLE